MTNARQRCRRRTAATARGGRRPDAMPTAAAARTSNGEGAPTTTREDVAARDPAHDTLPIEELHGHLGGVEGRVARADDPEVELGIDRAERAEELVHLPADVSVDEEPDEKEDARGDEVVDAAQALLDRQPVRAEDLPTPDKEHDPGDRTGDREQREAPERHARDARGHRDERAHDGEHPREEHRRRAVAGEPAVREIEVVRADEKVASPAVEERPAAECPDRIACERAGGVADDSGDHRAPIRPRGTGERLGHAARDAPASERQDELRGDRDRRALDGHSDRDADVAEPRVQRFEEREHDPVEDVEHSWVSSPTKGKGVADFLMREGHMPETTALAPDMRDALRKTGRAELLVGVPSYKNAATSGHGA